MEELFQKPIKKLGFGLMRLPKNGGAIDIRKTEQMIDRFLGAGFTYFDTAYMYRGSEEAAKQALVRRYPRESYQLATKLYGGLSLTKKSARKQFYVSLERTGAEYFDCYLMHALMTAYYRRYDTLKLWDFAREQKEKGLIRHIGFSFHSGPKLLDRILTEHPEAEFVQLQINYADWDSPLISARKNYEVAKEHNVPVIVMEPVKGGLLANPPEAVKKLFSEVDPNASYASWAIRFAASLPGVLTVLSGMSNMEQMDDNLSYMTDFKPLDDREQKAIRTAMGTMRKSDLIPCTGCGYCTKGCPKHIPIPDIFSAMNEKMDGHSEDGYASYKNCTEGRSRANDCIGCKKCEKACPQHLPITRNLRVCAQMWDAGASE